jgi:hypothetical protein
MTEETTRSKPGYVQAMPDLAAITVSPEPERANTPPDLLQALVNGGLNAG